MFVAIFDKNLFDNLPDNDEKEYGKDNEFKNENGDMIAIYDSRLNDGIIDICIFNEKILDRLALQRIYSKERNVKIMIDADEDEKNGSKKYKGYNTNFQNEFLNHLHGKEEAQKIILADKEDAHKMTIQEAEDFWNDK